MFGSTPNGVNIRVVLILQNNLQGSKQSSRGVLKKKCPENLQQIYRRTPMPKCDFNKVALQNDIAIFRGKSV